MFRQQGGGPPRGYDRITKAMGKAFDPVLVLRRTKSVLNLWNINILSISTTQVNLKDMQAGFRLGFRTL